MSTETTQIEWDENGDKLVGLASYRVLETFDDAVTEDIREGVRRRTKAALQAYPELAGETITIGRLDPDDDMAGRAWFWNMLINYRTDKMPTMMTVYHELAHLAIHVRDQRGEDVPITSEEYCSIFAVARMPPDHIDGDSISYLGRPSEPQADWPEICERALEYREDNHNYIQQCKEWLGV